MIQSTRPANPLTLTTQRVIALIFMFLAAGLFTIARHLL